MGKEKSKLSQRIIKEIVTRIENGEYKLHDKLSSELQLAKEYEVARSTIREALGVLKSLGIISSRQGGGHYISETNVSYLLDSLEMETKEFQEMKNLFEIRVILEKEAAYLAAERRTEGDLEELEQALRAFEKALSSPDQTGSKEDLLFHKLIIKATHNPVMVKIMEDLTELYQRTLEVTLKQNIGLIQKRKKVLEEHIVIFEAIKEAKPELAKVQCGIHLENVLKKINLLFSNAGKKINN